MNSATCSLTLGRSVPTFGCKSKLTDLRYVAIKWNLDITYIAVKNSDISNI